MTSGNTLHSRPLSSRIRWRTALWLWAAAFVTGCWQQSAWDRHPIPSPPDHTCRTGSDGGFDVYLWDCEQGSHTVVYQWCAGLSGCKEAQKETAACGSLTAFEQSHSADLKACSPIPTALTWQP